MTVIMGMPVRQKTYQQFMGVVLATGLLAIVGLMQTRGNVAGYPVNQRFINVPVWVMKISR